MIVADGVMNIRSSKGLADDPTLSAIEVIPRALAPPTVTTTVPGADEADVSVGADPSATFSRGMDESTFTSSTFTLAGPSGAVPASVSYDAASRTATLTPSAQLAHSTTYTATLASSLKSADGAPLGTAYSWQFTTEAPPPPDISLTVPDDGATGVSPATAVRATFTRPMDPTTITASSFTLRDGTGARVPANVSYDSTLQRATLMPSSPLSLSGTVHGPDQHDGQLGGLRDASRAVRLVVHRRRHDPRGADRHLGHARGRSRIRRRERVTDRGVLRADGLVDADVIDVHVDRPGRCRPGVGELRRDSNTATLDPTGFLSPSTAYTAALTSAVRGQDGTPLAGLSWSFTTIAAPTITSYTPTDGTTYFDRSSPITVKFSRSMAMSTITTSTFQLFAPDGSVVPATVTYDDPTTTATLTPSALLIGGATYAASVSSTIRAAGGSPLGGSDFVYRFTTSVCPCSLFSSLLTPAVQNLPTRDGRPAPGPWTYEMGVKFKVDEAMRLRGIRFFKSSGETGTHVDESLDVGRAAARVEPGVRTRPPAAGRRRRSRRSPCCSRDPSTSLR